VMEEDRDLVGRIGVVEGPVSGVVEQHAEIGRELPGFKPILRSLARNWPAQRQTSPYMRLCRAQMKFSLSTSCFVRGFNAQRSSFSIVSCSTSGAPLLIWTIK
jgi:hypothetical protein